MKKILLSLLMLCAMQLAAQDLLRARQTSYFTYVYKITNAEAKALYKNFWLKETMFHSLVDSYPTDSIYKKQLPTGHYVFVHAVGDKLHAELESIDNLSLTILNNHRDLIVVFHDKNGKEIQSLRPSIGIRHIPFSDKLKAYRISTTNRQGMIEAAFDGHVNYFSIDKRYNNTLPLRAKRRVLGTFPINHLISPLTYVGRTILGLFNHSNINPPGIYYRTKRIFEPKNFTGFVVLNKPMFKPGDTVKLKAFVTTRKGKAVQRNASIVMNGYYHSFDKKLADIKPYRAGAYSYEFVLTDSLKLKLDKDYSLTLKDKRRNIYPNVKFRYEQYELKQNVYTIRDINKENHKPAIIMMKGIDSNDQPLFDIQVEVTVLSKSMHAYDGKSFYLKDTLWTHQLKLEPIGETRLALPDSIFPNAFFDYEINAVFSNTENERELKKLTATFNPTADQTTWKIKSDSLWITPHDKNNLTIMALNRENEVIWQASLIEIQNFKIDPYVATYHITHMDKNVCEIIMSKQSDGLEILAQRTTDSLKIACSNPAKILFRYQLFKNSRIVESGIAQTLFLAKSAHVNERYYLSIQYVWAGQPENQNYDLLFAQKPLAVTIQHAPTAFPGEQVDFTVTVKDAFNQPVANADVTAYAYTKKFKNFTQTGVPQFEKTKSRKIFNQFSQQTLSFEVNNSLNYSFWQERLGLDSLEYYQFANPGNKIYQFETTGEDSIIQVAPFVMFNRWLQAPQYIEINNQIVYYAGNESVQPYSFRVRPGDSNTIVIRFQYSRITIKNVLFKKGMKHILSLDMSTLPEGVVKEKFRKPYLTKEEQQKINNSFLTIERKGSLAPVAYFQQDDQYHVLRPLEKWEQRYWEVIGPFHAGLITYNVGTSFSFPFKPGQHYTFNNNTIEQSPSALQKQLTRRLSYQTFRKSLPDQVLTASRVESFIKNAELKREIIVKKYPDNQPTTPVVGSIEISNSQFAHDNVRLATFILNLDIPDEFYIFPGAQLNYGPLLPGNYQVIVLHKDESYIKPQPVQVKAYGRTWLNLKEEAVTAADTFSHNIIKQIKRWSTEGNYIEQDRLKELQQMRTLYYRETVNNTLLIGGRWVTGVVRDGDGFIPGVNVMVKGTTIGTTTDLNGEFRLYVPYNGVIVTSFIGYATEEIESGNKEYLETKLNPDVAQLSEVVVVGYGSVQRAMLTGAVATLSGKAAGVQLLSGAAPGVADSIQIRIRGASAFANSGAPLIILDGVAYNSFDDIDPSMITAIEVLRSEVSVAIYGSRAANGVILVSTKPGMQRQTLLQTKLPESIMPLQDLANKGSSLRKNFRDDAFWQPKLRTNEKGEVSFSATLPDDITGWSIRALAMGSQKRTGMGNSKLQAFKPLAAQLALPNFLVQGDSALAIGKITNYTSDSLHINRSIEINKRKIQHGSIHIKNSWIDSLTLAASNEDSLELKYEVNLNKYSDGELRKIPVLPIGSLETTGLFVALPRDTSFVYESKTKGDIKIIAQVDLLDVLLTEIEALRVYPYECNEQLASKLKALLARKLIFAYRKEKFDDDNRVEKIIKKLVEHQHEGGGWSWWARNSQSTWITRHVVEALLWAKQLGYSVRFDEEGMRGFIMSNTDYTSWTEQLNNMLFLSELGQPVAIQSIADSAKKRQPSLHEQLMLQRLYQLQNLPVDWQWIESHKRETLKGNWYWGEARNSLWNNDVDNTLLVYRMMEKKDTTNKSLYHLQHYFLEKRKTNQWNTYEASRIIETMLPSMLKQHGGQVKPELVINGKVINQFPYQTSFTNAEIISIAKKGSAPVYFSAYQQNWNPEPNKVENDFIITTYWKNILQAGQPVKMEVHMQVKKDAEYVMINVPIPAGCSYQKKSQVRMNGEIHREYDTHEVRIYCETLRAGTYTYSIELLPRYAGTYTLNPAKVEWMYFPVVFGRNELKRAIIR